MNVSVLLNRFCFFFPSQRECFHFHRSDTFHFNCNVKVILSTLCSLCGSVFWFLIQLTVLFPGGTLMMVPACNFSLNILSRFQIRCCVTTPISHFFLETKQQQPHSTLWHILLVRQEPQECNSPVTGENRAPVHYLKKSMWIQVISYPAIICSKTFCNGSYEEMQELLW